MWIDLVNMVLSFLSLLATIAISIVIYKLEKKNRIYERKKEISEKAKKFIIDNSDEIEYLHWATIATGCFPQNRHVRKIYNEFSYLDDDTKKEVLKQRDLCCELISNDRWITTKIKLIIDCIARLGIGEHLLYDEGKYFTKNV